MVAKKGNYLMTHLMLAQLDTGRTVRPDLMAGNLLREIYRSESIPRARVRGKVLAGKLQGLVN